MCFGNKFSLLMIPNYDIGRRCSPREIQRVPRNFQSTIVKFMRKISNDSLCTTKIKLSSYQGLPTKTTTHFRVNIDYRSVEINITIFYVCFCINSNFWEIIHFGFPKTQLSFHLYPRTHLRRGIREITTKICKQPSRKRSKRKAGKFLSYTDPRSRDIRESTRASRVCGTPVKQSYLIWIASQTGAV